MMINLVSWNVRGLNDLAKRRIIKSLVLEWKADIRYYLLSRNKIREGYKGGY